MLKKRKVYGHFFNPNTTPLSGLKVTFKLSGAGRVADKIILPARIDVYTDSTGRFESELWVNSQSSSPCHWLLESENISLIFNIPEGEGEISIDDCLD